MPGDKIKCLGSQVAMGRATQPYEIAPSYVFLACDRCSSYFTGQVLHPNGKVFWKSQISCGCNTTYGHLQITDIFQTAGGRIANG
ncbi:unnamed protein product [Dovyalis caffra]|uniref:Uncharacterized protein n=1 Tax=Dovyalis caffra TaxID=77055 RepID=A0AAV1QYW4_9ROSI|nr:unnamed protein product [Dovyalis caffra]